LKDNQNNLQKEKLTYISSRRDNEEEDLKTKRGKRKNKGT